MGEKAVPWLCHICDRKFSEGEGGVCSECYRSTCATCFDASSPRTCQLCARGDGEPDETISVVP